MLTRILIVLLTALPTAAVAQVPSGIQVEQAWSRATPGGSREAVVYLRIVNHGAAADRLVAARTPVADRAEPHQTKMDGGIMKMRPLSALTIAPGQTIELKPGGDHLMLTGLKRKLERGDSFPLMLRFEKAGEIQVMVAVEAAGARGPSIDHGAMPGRDQGEMKR